MYAYICECDTYMYVCMWCIYVCMYVMHICMYVCDTYIYVCSIFHWTKTHNLRMCLHIRNYWCSQPDVDNDCRTYASQIISATFTNRPLCIIVRSNFAYISLLPLYINARFSYLYSQYCMYTVYNLYIDVFSHPITLWTFS